MYSRRKIIFGAIKTALSGISLTACSEKKEIGVPDYADKFNAVFEPDFSWQTRLGSKDPFQVVPFKVIEAGELYVTSSKIVACDPFVSSDREPFAQIVPMGKHRLRISYPMIHGQSGGRVSFARLDFSPQKPVTWRLAVIPGQDISTLKKDEIFGYPVDAGTGCFCDSDTFKEISKQVDEKMTNTWISEGADEGKKLGVGFFLNKKFGAGNILMFESGWGDGFYASYFGFDKDGAVASLLTDYAVIDWADKPKG